MTPEDYQMPFFSSREKRGKKTQGKKGKEKRKKNNFGEKKSSEQYLLTSSLSLGVPVPRVYTEQPSVCETCRSHKLSFSLSSHRYSSVGLLFNSHFIDL
jgi:hypothetical protein